MFPFDSHFQIEGLTAQVLRRLGRPAKGLMVLLRFDFDSFLLTQGQVMLSFNQVLVVSGVEGVELVGSQDWAEDSGGLADLIVRTARQFAGGDQPTDAEVTEAATYLILTFHQLLHDIEAPVLPFAHYRLIEQTKRLFEKLGDGQRNGDLDGLLEEIAGFQAACTKANFQPVRFLPTTALQLRIWGGRPEAEDGLSSEECLAVKQALTEQGTVTLSDEAVQTFITKTKRDAELRRRLIREVPGDLRSALEILGLPSNAEIVVRDGIGPDLLDLSEVESLTITLASGLDGSLMIIAGPKAEARVPGRGLLGGLLSTISFGR